MNMFLPPVPTLKYPVTRIFLAIVAAVCAVPCAAQTLTVGRTLSDSLQSESKHSYTVEIASDRYVYGFVNQISVDVVVRILDSDGEAVRVFDSPSRGPETFQFFSDTAGTYTIEVTPFERAEGAYEIVLLVNEAKARSPRGVVDQLMRPFTGRDRPGAVVSVLKEGKVVLAKGYGMSNLTYDEPMTENTGMSVASVSKQFTGMAILLLEQQGKLTLDDDVRKHIPELKDFGTPVTLRHMLNHTSGYREVLNFLPIGGWSATDAMTREVPIHIVQRQAVLQNVPGSEYNYNNTAFMLLATVVERASGEDFAAFMEKSIFRPLGMNNTTIKTHQGQVIPGSSQGYDDREEGGFRYVTDFASAYGASGVNSTAVDMTKWMLNYRDGTVGGLESIERLTTRGILANGDTTAYGLGIGVRKWRGRMLYGHSGGETSHRSYFAYLPEIASGVFVSSNHPAFSSAIWADVADAYFGELLEPEDVESDEPSGEPEDDTAPTPAQLEAIAGTYSFVGAPLMIEYTVENGDLFAQATSQPKFALRATSDSTFEFIGVEASVTFHYEADGSVKRGMHHQGPDSPMEKVEIASLTEAELRAYAGRYYNAELETFYTITVDDGELEARHRINEPFTLKHVKDDEFSGGAWYMRNITFHRDPAGSVAGFTAGNGRTRGVWFVKIEI